MAAGGLTAEPSAHRPADRPPIAPPIARPIARQSPARSPRRSPGRSQLSAGEAPASMFRPHGRHPVWARGPGVAQAARLAPGGPRRPGSGVAGGGLAGRAGTRRSAHDPDARATGRSPRGPARLATALGRRGPRPPARPGPRGAGRGRRPRAGRARLGTRDGGLVLDPWRTRLDRRPCVSPGLGHASCGRGEVGCPGRPGDSRHPRPEDTAGGRDRAVTRLASGPRGPTARRTRRPDGPPTGRGPRGDVCRRVSGSGLGRPAVAPRPDSGRGWRPLLGAAVSVICTPGERSSPGLRRTAAGNASSSTSRRRTFPRT